MSNLALVKSAPFGSMQCDFYGDNNEVYMTRKQIGEALEYANPQKAIDNLHAKHSDRLDRFSVTLKLRGTDNKQYSTVVYSAKGIYEICRWSKQAKADAFFDFVYDVLESLRKGESQIIPSVDTKVVPTDIDNNRRMETEARLRNAKTRQARLLVSVADKFKDILPKEQVQVLIGNATELISDAPMLPKPQITKTYTAGEIGASLGVSANKVGRLANKYDIKTEEYGIWVLDKSRHSDKQVSSFQYNEAGKRKIAELLKQEGQ
ncbi:BRO family protein [Exiguobacterium sp. s192]|uniref:BRO family protein n=1 Tax=Exiguobacterium sp. s192 TaxID=2751206 RepID=UPI001BEAED6A|nr:BRO family protein [Exiguobacterium sp. s192]